MVDVFTQGQAMAFTDTELCLGPGSLVRSPVGTALYFSQHPRQFQIEALNKEGLPIELPSL